MQTGKPSMHNMIEHKITMSSAPCHPLPNKATPNNFCYSKPTNSTGTKDKMIVK